MEIVIKVPLEAFERGDVIIRLVPDTESTEEAVEAPKKRAKGFGPQEVVDIYNEYAVKHKWVRCFKMGDKLKDHIKKALANYKNDSDWKVIMKGLEKDPFFSGSTSDYKTSIMTLFHTKRYETFFDKGSENQETGTDAIVGGWLDKLKAIE